MNMLDFDNMTIDEIVIDLKLDQEERELLKSIENDEWVSILNAQEEMKSLQEIANNQLARQKIEVQVSIQDANKIHDLASELGQSVSSFTQDIIHKYLRGELVEKT